MFSLASNLDYLLIETRSIARNILTDNGEIRLGALFKALQKDSTKIKYGSYVAKQRALFRGLSKDEFFFLYEMTLLHLERTQGPLTCHRDFDPTSYMQWGYSCRSLPHEAARSGYGFSRYRALQGDHPDAPFFQAGVMPETVWRKRKELKRAA